jgi:hypothetical protein
MTVFEEKKLLNNNKNCINGTADNEYRCEFVAIVMASTFIMGKFDEKTVETVVVLSL